MFLKSEIKNIKKTFSWQETFSVFLSSLLTKPIYTVLQNYEDFIICNNNNNKIQNSDLLSNDHCEEHSLISGTFGEKMSMITTFHSFLFSSNNMNNNFELLNKISPIWRQKLFNRLALPLLKYLNESNNDNKNSIKNDNNKNNNNNNSNNNNDNDNNNNNNNNNNNYNPHTSGCLMGLLSLIKNMSSNILSSHTSEISNIIIQTLHSTSNYNKNHRDDSGKKLDFIEIIILLYTYVLICTRTYVYLFICH